MEPRQIINIAHPTSTSTVTRLHCTPFTLPSMGVLSLGPSSYLTISTDVVFLPECTGLANDIIITNAAAPSSLTDFRDPFYASTLPQCYVLAACTVIAYMLVIMLLITPRTFLHEGAVVLGRRGFTNGPSGGDAGIGIGGRPWLQKVAALTVAISLTIATAVTFQVAERQYNDGYMDATKLQSEVEDGQELKIIRVISDTFLWLAQAQTLIRLFPRQREKVIIKWTAFALITLDVLFSTLNSFVYDGSSRPRSFVDAVPALSYLFQLALSLLYCAWVIYYSITKSRFAFSHPQMRNICLLAVLSLVAVLVPVVFFVLDISKPTLAGWGDYVRWVGAAAASVVVWEWVERIEALERNDKKDGVLGREVFDGDEMLEITPSADSTRGQWKDGGNDGGGTATGSNGISWPGMTGLATRYKHRLVQDVEVGEATNGATVQPGRFGKRTVIPRPPLWPSRPPPAATPISRTDTASAESTVYAIHYHPIGEATPPIHDAVQHPRISRSNSMEISDSISNHERVNADTNKPTVTESKAEVQGPSTTTIAKEQSNPWQALAKANPFRKQVQAPPPEVSAHAVISQEGPASQGKYHKWDIRGRLEDFAATQADRIREKTRPNMPTEPLPLTIIPAPTRRNLSTALEEPEIGVERP
ncbi:hypothetical protein B7494_g4834 [Chlorociboria aeruginascens]|nr:hypothetical protein B7494_g4834 [Chlorociboria aeruginascens]